MADRLLWGLVPPVALFVALVVMIVQDEDSLEGGVGAAALLAIITTIIPVLVFLVGTRRDSVLRISMLALAALCVAIVISIATSSDGQAGLALLVVPIIGSVAGVVVSVVDRVTTN